MAEENATEVASVKTGSGKKMILLILVGILLLGGGGGAAWFFMGGKDENPNTHEEQAKAEGAHEEPGPIMELEPFLLNLADRDELRFLKVSIKLELDRPEEKTDFQNKVPAIRDALLVLLSSKESQILRTVNGKRRVREEIMTRVNGVMSKGKIANVFFTDFIIQ
ncbi:MAG: flagellar basal body-associated FliL family protein [Nitrospirota bacterium]|nr:flagellar basal body-associated FliL family protein [Nitrospirota bacterium]MDH4360591.1 flagellar basal body-associated FliL family protein [Nitrospirota bacterium]MDH5574444.1 flagellar basal body-associated FliL family protein [Nitrospirota bacterium]